MFVHPELTAVLDALPERRVNVYDDIHAERAFFKQLMAPLMGPDDRVDCTVVSIDGPDGNVFPADIVRPRAAAPHDASSDGADPVGAGERDAPRATPGEPLPAVLYLHGGGFAYGEVDGPSPLIRDLSAGAGVVVVSPNYRLAPEHRFPAGIEDCYATLEWMAAHADELGIDPARIGVAGASAGGNLSAAVTLMTRDRGGPAIAHQALLIPLLDDRDHAPSRRAMVDRRVINGPGITHTWRNYLGADWDPADDTSPYAAPARAHDLTGLPPAYVMTCGLDPLRDEGMDYARRLAEADVPVDLHDVPGAWHFFEAYAPDTDLARRTTAHWIAAIATALHAPVPARA